MIKSFANSQTLAIFKRQFVKKLSKELQIKTLEKLIQIENAKRLKDLEISVGNKLEALVGERKGQYSIRVNKQWRICFSFREGDFWDVELVDYH